MTTRGFSILIFIGSLISWINFSAVLFYIDPYKAGTTGVAFFFLSFILALLGSLYILGVFFRRKFVKYQPAFQRTKVAWRQSIWFTTLVVGIVYLYSNDLINFLNVILLIVILIILEFFFISYKKEI